MEKIKAGIIGCGRISSVYRAAFENMRDEVEIAFVVDKELGRAEKLAASFSGCGYSDKLEDLLRQPLSCLLYTSDFQRGVYIQKLIDALQESSDCGCCVPIDFE